MNTDTAHLTLTANNRLARSLQQEYARVQVQAGKAAWETPAIMTWQAWLAECHQTMALRASEPVPMLLSATQSRALWQQVIEASDAGKTLLRPGETAKAVAQAWTLLQDHRLSIDKVKADGAEDVRAFLGWATRYRSLCRKRHWLDPSCVAAWLEEALGKTPLDLPGHIELRGFDELSPRQAALLAAVEQQGVTVEQAAFPQRSGRTKVRGLPDTAGEIAAAAAQTRRWLQHHPMARIGIVVPDLQAHRAALSRALESALTPASRLNPRPSPHLPFNLSLGQPLAQTGLVADALTALKLMHGALDWPEAGRLLRSPYFDGHASEAGARARMDAALRETGGLRWSLNALERAAEAREAKRLRAGLLACRSAGAGQEGRFSPGAWARHFSDWLDRLGWCRRLSLGSQDEQTRQAWFDLLREFAAQSTVTGHMSLHQARERLAAMAADTLFQPRSADAPVQVLGLLEASGLEFDYLWVMGLEDATWPPAPGPNPFLPYALQRRHHMPHATPERELMYAERVMQRLLKCADEVVLSWPQRDGDRQLSPSALLPQGQSEDVVPPKPLWPRRAGLLENFDDGVPEPVPPGPVAGGSRVLTDQSGCPFRALAKHRLRADPLEQPQATLGAAERGQLVHRALEFLWEELKSQQQLMHLDARALRQRVTAAVDRACARLEGQTPHLAPGFWQLERLRLVRLLESWLDIEKARAPFATGGGEQELTLTLADLEFSLRIDRRDTLEDGGMLVLDYKTGYETLYQGAWVGERPMEPQLPSYALAVDPDGSTLAGLAFAWVRPREPRFTGITRGPDQLPGVRALDKWTQRPSGRDDLPGLIDYWRHQLTALAADFRNSVSDTAPRHEKECRQCQRHVLCRVRELRGVETDGDE